jgi:hypothetical protein
MDAINQADSAHQRGPTAAPAAANQHHPLVDAADIDARHGHPIAHSGAAAAAAAGDSGLRGSHQDNAGHNSGVFADNHGLDALQAATAVQGLDPRAGIAGHVQQHGVVDGGSALDGHHQHHRPAAPGPGQHAGQQQQQHQQQQQQHLHHHHHHPHRPHQGDDMSASAVAAVAAAAVTVAQQLTYNESGGDAGGSAGGDGGLPVDMALSYQVDPALGVDVDHHGPFDQQSVSPPSAGTSRQPTSPSDSHYQQQEPSPQASQPPLSANGIGGSHHHHQQQEQQAYLGSPTDASADASGASAGNGVVRTHGPMFKKTRLSRACDGCSLRKVKCDSSGPPCRPCAELKVPCTNDREKKRRGPPNRHLDKLRQGPLAVKRARMVDTTHCTDAMASSQTLTSLSPDTPVASAGVLQDLDSLAPLPVIRGLVGDYFTFMHALMPFPMEEGFCSALEDRADRTRPGFLGLVASLLAALTSRFPRVVLEHLKNPAPAQAGGGGGGGGGPPASLALPRPIEFAEQCYNLALSSRGVFWTAHPFKSLDDVMTSFFLSVASEAMGNQRAMRMYLSETVTLLREVGLSRTSNSLGSPPEAAAAALDDQLGRRIFWAVVRQKRALSQAGVPNDFGLPQPTAYLERPDDEQAVPLDFDLLTDAPQLGSIAGFLASLDVYNTMSTLDDAGQYLGWPEKRNCIFKGLMDTKDIIRRLPAELQISSGLSDNALSSRDLAEFRIATGDPHRRRNVAYDVLRANLHVSLLATRTYFVSQHARFRQENLDASGDQDPEEMQVLQRMRDECRFLAQDVIAVIAELPRHALEPDFHALFARLSRVINCATESAVSSPSEEGRSPEPATAALRWLGDWLVRMNEALPSPPPTEGHVANHATTAGVSEQDEALAEALWDELCDWQRRVTNDSGPTNGAIVDDGLPMELQTIKFEESDGAGAGLGMDTAA